ncbi:MAG: SH3 domain-containing protein [Rhodospirillaceae bacterium]
MIMMAFGLQRGWRGEDGLPGDGGLFAAVRSSALFAAVCVAGLFPAGPAEADDNRGVMFLGHPIIPMPGRYLVTKDVQVRKSPETKGEKVTTFKEGARIDVFGRAKGSWMAVRRKGKDLGFVYEPILVPLLSDPPAIPVISKASFPKGRCDYKIQPEGETPIESQEFRSFDYRVKFECRVDDRSFAFGSPMFISEGPYNNSRQPIHQIGLDVLELSQDYDRFFSTNLLYDRLKGEVRFDGVSVDAYKVKTPPKARRAKSATDALRAAVALALAAWSEAFWRDFSKALKKEDE